MHERVKHSQFITSSFTSAFFSAISTIFDHVYFSLLTFVLLFVYITSSFVPGHNFLYYRQPTSIFGSIVIWSLKARDYAPFCIVRLIERSFYSLECLNVEGEFAPYIYLLHLFHRKSSIDVLYIFFNFILLYAFKENARLVYINDCFVVQDCYADLSYRFSFLFFFLFQYIYFFIRSPRFKFIMALLLLIFFPKPYYTYVFPDIEYTPWTFHTTGCNRYSII